MTDIVERLRTVTLPLITHAELREAAAEIERLRANADVRTDAIIAAGREIERLRITVNDQAATITKLFEEVQQLQERIRHDHQR